MESNLNIHLLELYRWAAQDPPSQARVLDELFKRIHPGQQAVTLREDFCGGACDSMAWVQLSKTRRATAVDLCEPALAWSRVKSSKMLGKASRRLRWIHADLTRPAGSISEQADIIAALNFSIFYLHTRPALMDYLRQALEGLTSNGILVLNVFGGTRNTSPGIRKLRISPGNPMKREALIPPFRYEWEILGFEPKSGRLQARIHFQTREWGTSGPWVRHQNAFVYDWRLWHPNELVKAMIQVGFKVAQIWEHRMLPRKEGVRLGPVESVSRRQGWVYYVIGSRS